MLHHSCLVQPIDEVPHGTPTFSTYVTRDTRAWHIQVWVSFGSAVFLCATGLAYLPGQSLDRAFMVMGYVFCLSTVFVLSKSVRDAHLATQAGGAETPMWRLVVWGGFAVAMGLTGWDWPAWRSTTPTAPIWA